MDGHLRRRSRQSRPKSSGARWRLRSRRHRHQNPAKNEGWRLLQLLQGQMAFRKLAQKYSRIGHPQRKRSATRRRLRSPPPPPKIGVFQPAPTSTRAFIPSKVTSSFSVSLASAIFDPPSWKQDFHFLQARFSRCYSHRMRWPTVTLDDWKPVSRPIAIVAISFYFLFLLYAAFDRSGFLLLDFANLAIHEAGHPLFGIFGGGSGFAYTVLILGGTLLDLLGPLASAIYGCVEQEQEVERDGDDCDRARD